MQVVPSPPPKQKRPKLTDELLAWLMSKGLGFKESLTLLDFTRNELVERAQGIKVEKIINISGGKDEEDAKK